MKHQPVIEPLNRPECLRLMRDAPVGRPVCTVATTPVVQPVNFTLAELTKSGCQP
ncbi:MAG: hypothetical protein ABJA34_06440 [Pseudonocardiales bacterium]